MKHISLKRAIEFAESLRLRVVRRHLSSGLTRVIVSAHGDDGDRVIGDKCYTTGGATSQARFITNTVKGFTLVEDGLMIKRLDGGIVFFSYRSKTLYQWKESVKAWQEICTAYPLSARYLRELFPGRHCEARVKVDKLQSGVNYYG